VRASFWSCVVLLAAVFPCGGSSAQEQQPIRGTLPDSAPGLMEYVLTHVDRFAPPEYYARKRTIRQYQRRAYAEVLLDVTCQDGLMAVLDYIKLLLQTAYSLNHTPVTFMSESKECIELPIDWSFPADPWGKESWGVPGG
jgi:hypothetical protein